MKILKWSVLIVILIVVAAVVIVYVNLDRIVKNTVETQGTQQLNVATTLSSVNLGLLGGTVSLNNFSVGSPKGFTAPQLLSVGKLSVDTGGIGRLRDQPIHVASITIHQPKLVIEQQGGKLNFKALMDGLPTNPDQNPTPDQTGEKKTVKLVIDDLAMEDARVVVRPGIPGLSEEIEIPIPAIDVKNIGNADGANNGAAVKDVVTTIITQMAAKAADSGKLPPAVKAILTGNLADISDKLTGAAKDQVNKAAGKLLDKVPGGLGDVLKSGSDGKNGTPGDAAKNILNQGLGAFGGATTKPGK